MVTVVFGNWRVVFGNWRWYIRKLGFGNWKWYSEIGKWHSETGQWYSEIREWYSETGSGIRKLGGGIRKRGVVFGNLGVVFGNWEWYSECGNWNWKPPACDHRTLVWFFSIRGALQRSSHFLSKERIIAASSCAKPRVRRPKHTLCKSASRTSLRVKLPHSMAAEICSLKLPSVSFRPNYSIYWPDGVAVLIPYCFEGVAALIPHEDQLKLRSY